MKNSAILLLLFIVNVISAQNFKQANENYENPKKNAIKSAATIREEGYILNGCSSVEIPNDPEWNVSFKITQLKGDLAPNNTYTRRDPSAVIKVDGIYYVWYSYSLTFDNNKTQPWDLNDIYYATSTDGITWDEKGKAIGRGSTGSFDHRSVFTTEILACNGKYYLVYQAAKDLDGILNRNTIGMATADSPNGPWTKLVEPILHPTYTDEIYFDNNAVHDPCIVPYNGTFYLYYKGECNCFSAPGCTSWCNPVCGTYYNHGGGFYKQVKWGVAISDNPTGPYVKSEYNPITNTGHEVMVWPYKTGIAILQHKDGAEAETIQYSEDGLNFSIKGSATDMPEAGGLYRRETSDINPHTGITWGLGHQLNWNAGPNGWMYIYRFDIESSNPEEPESAINGALNSDNVFINYNTTEKQLIVKGIPNKYTITIYSLTGKVCFYAESFGEASINVNNVPNGLYIAHVLSNNGNGIKKILIH